jgi:hypothetical protein
MSVAVRNGANAIAIEANAHILNRLAALVQHVAADCGLPKTDYRHCGKYHYYW